MRRLVLVTRAEDQSTELEAALRAVDLEPLTVPAIAVELEPAGGGLDAAAHLLQSFEWAVVTSPNGARAILRAAERVFTPLGAPRWAAIGQATAEVLEREGIEIAFRPSRAAAAAMAAELPIRPGDEVVLFRGDLAGDELRRDLERRGAAVTDVVAYRTIEAPAASRDLLRHAVLDRRPAAVLFASGSAIRGLIGLARDEAIEVTSIPAVCIGPQTADEAVRFGFEVVATAPTPDVEAFAATTVAAISQPVETR